MTKPDELTELENKNPELRKAARWFVYVSESQHYSFFEQWKAFWDYIKLAVKIRMKEIKDLKDGR